MSAMKSVSSGLAEASVAFDSLKVKMGHTKTNLLKVIDVITQKSLTNMVKGIRNAKERGQAAYIAKCMSEIKLELRQTNPHVKANGVRKLLYLHMIGYDMGWAAFHVVELMSSPWFGHRRVGYLAASVCFTQDTDVIVLTTHLFRKSFMQNSTQHGEAFKDGQKYEIGSSLSCLANIITPELGEQINKDIVGLMNSTQPYIRKKATLLLLKIFKRFPKGLRLSFPILKEKLKDQNPGVVSAAVYVICELASKNPRNYLALAPEFFKILTSSSNNWVLIKVVKLLGNLVPLEPRLAKKLTEPLTDVITTTPAKSLLYECINTLLKGKISSKSTVRLCLDKLRTFVEDPDQNLKYLGLLGLHKLMQKHPRAVAEHKDLILDCLNDEDVSIRTRALDLITAMVSKKNLIGIIKRLVMHLKDSDGSYRNVVFARIVHICSQENYSYLTDFGWYVGVLVDLTHISGVTRDNACVLNKELLDVAVRVPLVRKYVVRCMMEIILSGRLLSESQNTLMSGMSEVLQSASWIVGEYAIHAKHHTQLVTNLLSADVVSLPMNVQVTFIQNVFKLFGAALNLPWELTDNKGEVVVSNEGHVLLDANHDDVKAPRKTPLVYSEWTVLMGEIMASMQAGLPAFTHSTYVEVQERAVVMLNLVNWLLADNGPGLFVAHTRDDSSEVVSVAADTSALVDTSVDTPAAALESKQQALTDDIFSLMDDPPAPAAADEVDEAEVETTTNSTEETHTESVQLDLFGEKNDSKQVESKEDGKETLSVLLDTTDPDCQAKAETVLRLIRQISGLCTEALNPVHPEAQQNVAVPSGLDLEAWINPPSDSEQSEDDYQLEASSESEESESSEVDENESPRARKKRKKKKAKAKAKRDKAKKAAKKKPSSRDRDGGGYGEPAFELKKKSKGEIAEARERRQKALELRMKDPYYMGPRTLRDDVAEDDVDDIPIKELDLDIELDVHVKKNKKKKKGKKKKNRSLSFSEDSSDGGRPPKIYGVVSNVEMPEGFAPKKADDTPAQPDSNASALDQDLTGPLGADEVFYTPTAYAKQTGSDDEAATASPSKSKKKKNKKAKKKSRRAEAAEEEEQAEPAAGEVKSTSSGASNTNPLVETLLENKELSLTYLPRLKNAEDRQVHVRIQAKSNNGQAYKVKVEISAKGVSIQSVSPGKVSSSGKGVIALKKLTSSVVDVDVVLVVDANVKFPLTLKSEVSYASVKGSSKAKKKSALQIPLALFIEPDTISKDQLTSFETASSKKGKISLVGGKYSIGQCLKLTSLVLRVKLLNAANMIAQYYGKLQLDDSHVIVRVEATKSDKNTLKVLIKSDSKEYCDQLFAELRAVLERQEE